MPNLTLSQMRARIQVLIPDAAIANADVTSAIQTAHEVFPMEFFVDHTDESLTLATDTYDYALPETSSVSTFAMIREIWIESETAGRFDAVIDPQLWRVDYDGVGVWNLHIDRRFLPIDGRALRIIGQKRYTTPSGDNDVITLHNGWVIQYAAGLIHAAQGGTDSTMAAWHQRMAAFHMAEAAKIEDNLNNRAYPGSYIVPGVL